MNLIIEIHGEGERQNQLLLNILKGFNQSARRCRAQQRLRRVKCKNEFNAVKALNHPPCKTSNRSKTNFPNILNHRIKITT
jgi:hypothetical protein